MKPDLRVNIAGVPFQNPVIAASGTFGFGEAYGDFYDVSVLGGICTKGLTWEPREGNAGIRVAETPGGMLNSVGLQNPGLPYFLRELLPEMRKRGTNILCNVGGSAPEDYLRCVDALNSADVDMVELNISCPNVRAGGMHFGLKAREAGLFVREVRRVCRKPLMVKLSPNAEDIVALAAACEEAGADALSLINTLKAMSIDIKARRPVFDNVFAGLSGPAVKPVALRMVWEVCRAVSIPVVGLGGIASASDAAEFLMAGAHAVQFGTAGFARPPLGAELVSGLAQLMEEQGFASLEEMRGAISRHAPATR